MKTSERSSYFELVRRGFTLIELLVVIGIIAILAAMLLPVLTLSKEKARNAKCMNNVRQLAVAVQLYATDDGGYPFSSEWSTSSSWFTSVASYYSSNYVIMQCPTFKGSRPANEALNFVFNPPSYNPPSDPTIPGQLLGVSYGYNGYGLSSANTLVWGNRGCLGLGVLSTSPDFRKVKVYSVASPSDMICVADSMPLYHPKSKYSYIYPYMLALNSIDMPPADRHGGNDNVAFVDGHVELIPHKNLVSNSELNRRRWNIDNEPHFEISF